MSTSDVPEVVASPNPAARQVREWGPRVVVAKQGQYGAAMISPEGFFALPAFPLEAVVDPTGAGDCFAGGLIGYLAAHPGVDLDHELFARAMAYGTAMASFNVEAFGVERLTHLTAGEISERVAELHRMTHFNASPVALRA